MVNLIKHICFFKSIFVKKGKVKGFIHPMTKIKGYNKIYLNKNSIIHKNAKINIQNGSVELDENSYINYDTSICVVEGKFNLGKNSFLNNGCNVTVLGDINIGDNVLIANMCNIVSGNHNFKDINIPIIQQGYTKSNITIRDNVWIGCNTSILGGITIEEGAIIGAGSIVVKNVGRNEIWAGNPAKFIKNR